METPTHSTSSRFFGHLLLAGFFLLGLLAPGQLGAAELKEGRVTQVIKDVKLLPEQAAPRPAAVNDKVQGGTAVRTGADSRTELTFADLTIARLGANTIFSVNEGSRTIDLGGGAILVRVPKNSGGAKISTAAVTAAITGTTMMAEYHKDLFKFIMLEGTAQICRVGAAGDCVEIQTGQMLQGRPGEPLGQPVTVDLRALVSSSKLLEGFGPLGSEDLIARAIADQEAGRVFVANAVRPDATGLEERDQRAATSTPSPSPTPQETPTPRPSVTPSPTPSPTATPTPSPSASPTPSPTASPTPSPTASPTPSPTASPTPSPTPQPTPDKFGTPPVITSTNLSVIDGGTTIQTDPSITRNGETGYGRIYRNFSQDGAASAWLFGSTSSFDATSHFDQIIAASAPFAAFKFSDLTILGDPTIVTANGGATSLALIGVNGIGAGTILNRLNLAGPNVLHFTGINSLLLATQSGSIDLKSDIAFADLNTLLLYARGANSDLNLGSMISNVITLGIAAENDINITNDLSVTSVTAHSGGDFNVSGNGAVHGQAFDIFAGGDLNFELARFPAGSSGVTSVHLDANSAVNIIAGNDSSLFEAALSVDVSGATISLTSDNGYPVVLNFNPSAILTRFSAGLGGIQAHDIGFVAPNLQLLSDGNIDIFRADSLAGSITAGGFLHTASDLTIGQLTSGAEIAVGGNLFAANIIAGTSISAQKITAFGGSISAGSDITSNSSIELQQNPPGTFGNITAGGNISANGGIFTPGTPAVVSAEGSISAHAILTGAVVAGTDITIDNSAGVFGFGIIANSVTANGGQAPFSAGLLTLINVATINSNGGSFSDHDGATPNDFVLQVGSITSTGPTFPIVSSNGGDANPDFADSNPGNGGSIFLGINTSGLTIGDGANLDSVVANGGAYNSGGPLGGGNGGSILMGVSGDVTVSLPYNEGPAISATSGIVSNVGSQFAGSGGVVDIAASGAFNIMGTIKVSSDDAAEFGTTGAGRESAAGGTIALRSGLTIGTGTGITITADGQLLSRLSLDAYNAGGTTGSIDLSTMGADIVVNGTVRADFGTVTMEQNDIPRMRPNGGLDTPAITLDGGTVQSATFNINGSGNLLIGPNLGTAINIFGGTWDVAHDITINAANTSFAYAFALDATAGHAINFNGGNANVPATLTLALSGSTTFTAGAGGINAPFVDILYAGAELNLNSSAGITANSIKFTDYYARGTVNAAGAISITGDLFQGVVTAGSNINVGGGVSVSTMAAGTTISVGQDISAGDLTAGGDITAGTTRVQNITAPQGLLNVAGGIYPSVFSTDPQFPDQGAMAPHVYTVDSIISPNGIDFSGNQFNGIRGYTSGGLLTLNVNSITFDYGSVGGATFNGADVNGFFGGVSPTVPGDGGIFTVNATGDITVNDPITASTGLTNAAGNLGGAGGTVTLDSSSGTITANSTIQVSHADPTPGPSRRSAVGGNIRLTSGKSGTASNRAVAIDVGNSGQLLSLLAAAPTPRPGGKIVIQATGANSDLNVGGKVRADGGLVDIRHTGTAGDVNLNGGSDNFLSVAADVIKVAALGDNGVLRVGGGTLSADTTLQLYATGFNGEVRFIGNVSLNGNATKSIAGNSVSINPGVLVSIGGPAASVYVNSTNGVPNAHYTGFGGSGTSSDSGTFGGSGANPPQPLDQAPALDPPSGRPASVSQPSGASQSAGGLRH